jgi:hypothetical protein
MTLIERKTLDQHAVGPDSYTLFDQPDHPVKTFGTNIAHARVHQRLQSSGVEVFIFVSRETLGSGQQLAR